MKYNPNKGSGGPPEHFELKDGIGGARKLTPLERLKKAFPKLPDDHIHVVVERPPAGEFECLISAATNLISSSIDSPVPSLALLIASSVSFLAYSPTSNSLRFRCGLASHLPTHPSNGARLITVLCSRSFHPLFTPLCFRCRLAPHLPTLPFRLLSVDSSLHGFSLSESLPTVSSAPIDRILELNCLVQGDDLSHLFTVKIGKSENVSTLKDMIKEKKTHAFRNIDADSLVLWKVSMPTDGLDTQDPGIVDLDDHQALLPMDALSEVFSNDEPLRKYLHIVVRSPPHAAGEFSAIILTRSSATLTLSLIIHCSHPT